MRGRGWGNPAHPHPHPHPPRCRLTAQFIILAAILLLGFAAHAQTTNGLSAAEIQGRQLAAEMLSQTPAADLKQTGTLKIHNPEGTISIPITFLTTVETNSWVADYTAMIGDPGPVENLRIVHQIGQPNQYFFAKENRAAEGFQSIPPRLNQSQIMVPFAGSDFWIADLGLEIFHWPQQTVTGHESRKMRDCTVLESDNPDPTNGYARVVTWIDNETHGLVHAEAYDTNNKLLKIFDPKKLKKVNGHWELVEIEIQNVQTHSRTWIRFDVTPD